MDQVKIVNNDTICALATASGGAIGIIRISGDKSLEILSQIFSKDLNHAAPNTIHYGHIVSSCSDEEGKEVPVDEVLVSVFRAPHSYTGEDAAEISCHGSRYILNKVLELLVAKGCRLARPGEYTQRAFLNGKMDLSQAEAVADLIASTNKATHQVALSQLRGNFSSELSHLREKLLKLTSLLELELDFSDHEDLEFADRTELENLAEDIDRHITTLARSFETGKAIKQGIPVAIVGSTNVGKSTLLNRLLHDDKAIVSDIHGTTRDVIEDTTEIQGVTFRFIDTAGIRETEDKIEQLGIERSFKKLNEASIVIWLTDERPSNREIEEMLELTCDKQLIIVQNKIDKSENSNPEPWMCPMLFISAKHGINIDQLEQRIYEAAHLPEIKENDVIITSARHYEALIRAHKNLERVIQSLQLQISGDLVAEDLRLALAELGEITGGEISTQETLNNIFSHFCVGK